jgi:hypothetical protein
MNEDTKRTDKIASEILYESSKEYQVIDGIPFNKAAPNNPVAPSNKSIKRLSCSILA